MIEGCYGASRSAGLAGDAVEQQPLAGEVGPPHAHLPALGGSRQPAAQHVPLHLPHTRCVLQPRQLLSLQSNGDGRTPGLCTYTLTSQRLPFAIQRGLPLCIATHPAHLQAVCRASQLPQQHCWACCHGHYVIGPTQRGRPGHVRHWFAAIVLQPVAECQNSSAATQAPHIRPSMSNACRRASLAQTHELLYLRAAERGGQLPTH